MLLLYIENVFWVYFELILNFYFIFNSKENKLLLIQIICKTPIQSADAHFQLSCSQLQRNTLFTYIAQCNTGVSNLQSMVSLSFQMSNTELQPLDSIKVYDFERQENAMGFY